MDFEWDNNKNEVNFEKHYIDFDLALGIFDGRYLSRIDDRADYGEERRIAIGETEGMILTVVYTMRGNVCRIISAWKAGRNDRRAYNQTKA